MFRTTPESTTLISTLSSTQPLRYGITHLYKFRIECLLTVFFVSGIRSIVKHSQTGGSQRDDTSSIHENISDVLADSYPIIRVGNQGEEGTATSSCTHPKEHRHQLRKREIWLVHRNFQKLNHGPSTPKFSSFYDQPLDWMEIAKWPIDTDDG
jgi:hypothetical protein